MFCTNCGKQIPDDSVFCVHCGNRIEQEESAPIQPAEPVIPQQIPANEVPQQIPVAPVQPVKPRKPVKPGPIIAISAGAVVLIVVLILGYFMFLSPSAQLTKHLKGGDMEAAYTVYQENFKDEELNDENLAYLEAGAEQVETDYKAGALTYTDAMIKLETMRGFDMINRKLDKIAESILIDAARDAGEKVGNGTMDADDAMEECNRILGYNVDDVHEVVADVQLQILGGVAEKIQTRYLNNEISYDEAIDELDELYEYDVYGVSDLVYQTANNMQTKREVEQTLEAAAGDLANGSFVDAMKRYQNVLDRDPENAAAKEGLETARNGYREAALVAANEKMAQGDFDGAIADVRNGMKVLGEDAQLMEMLKSIESYEITLTIEAAMAAVGEENFDGALELLDAMLEKYPNDQQLTAAAEEIIAKRPVGMQDLEEIDALDIWYKTGTIRDFFGNSYKGGMFLTYGDFKNTYAEYKLDGKYSRFTGNIIVSTDTRPDRRITYWIYLDDELVQTRENITTQTKPMKFDIDLTGAKTMKIVMTANAHIDTELYFVNTKVYKAEK